MRTLRHEQNYDCLFCGKPLADWFLAWYEHMRESPGCEKTWVEWMGNVRREAGGT
ncbi:MAG TPA: hypothetical protein VM681_09475 [Candidatus Thermoplasmatota archaeon]|nr:hypothetical protein [Candidatus Thermoplasmatota archaeon]